MKKTIVAALFVLTALTGCGSFTLGTVHAPPGVTVATRDVDVLVCKDRATQEANTDARVAASFVAGLTIVGAPIAIEAERAKQREVFKSCMEGKGYKVDMPQT